jgi:iron-sulfur cluster assembly protein
MNCPITVTPKAIEKLKEFLSQSPENTFVRVGVAGGGCGGYNWQLDLATEKKERDYVFDISSISILIDCVSVNYLKDTTIDWKETLMGSGFTFSAPQAKTCGCGESFSIKNG